MWLKYSNTTTPAGLKITLTSFLIVVHKRGTSGCALLVEIHINAKGVIDSTIPKKKGPNENNSRHGKVVILF